MIPFECWYSAHRGRSPWPWQVRLANQIAAGEYPAVLAIPTGCGKTTVIDIWGWVLSQALPVPVPRRLYWCIDRRVVVAQTARFAEALAAWVPGLQLAELRGGQSINVDGIVDPSRPAILVTTVDQLGSRLLWRPYGGISHYVAPIHAGLVGNDALIVLDEAHLSEPMGKTLEAIKQLRGEAIPLPWHIMHLTATPREAGGFQLGEDDYADPILSRRLTSPKIPSWKAVDEGSFVQSMISAALEYRKKGAAVVGIVVNTVRDARRIHTKLRRHGEATLIIGRVRAPERALRLADLDRVATGTRTGGRDPIFVVATSAIEVGADIDLDALVTQTCSVSSLTQRLGRLNRAGDLNQAEVTIIHVSREKENRHPGEDDCLKWIKPLHDLSPKALASVPRPAEACPDYPPLLASDVELLAQTSVPIPLDINPWLHGFQAESECTIVWRHLPDEIEVWVEFMAAVPVARRESLSCPLGVLAQWLRLREGQFSYLVKGNTDHWELNAHLFPGALVVLPAAAGGYDEYGWAPESKEPVVDVSLGEDRYLITDPDQLEAWEGGELSIPDGATVHAWTGGLCVYPRPWAELPDSEPSGEIALADHLAAANREAERLTAGLPRYLAEAVVKADKAHDIGKSDDRFQIFLGARSLPLAKSVTRSNADTAAARALSGLPWGWRHEMRSVAMLDGWDELIRYLVATHHGRGRSYLPAAPDPELWRSAGGEDWHQVWARQSERWGAWGLAYLEALVRLSDWFASRESSS